MNGVSRQSRRQSAARYDYASGNFRFCALCRFLGRRQRIAHHSRDQPASEKRQGTKSRDVGQDGTAGGLRGAAVLNEVTRARAFGVAGIVCATDGTPNRYNLYMLAWILSI